MLCMGADVWRSRPPCICRRTYQATHSWIIMGARDDLPTAPAVDDPASQLRPSNVYVLFRADLFPRHVVLTSSTAPWGGHSVFPNIYRDMRHPSKYNKGLQITYGFTVSLECLTADRNADSFTVHPRSKHGSRRFTHVRRPSSR